MLTSLKLTGSPEDLSNYHFQEENYYFSQASGVEGVLSDGGSETNGAVKIHGKLCPKLGLKEGQDITEETFTRLLYGENAEGEKITRVHKVIGIDLTFSAPKSVSIAGLLTEKNPKIIEAHDRSVLETMREIEMTHAYTRLTKLDKRPTGNMAFVTVRDGFNREHEPHLHTHVVVMNMTAIDGKVLALDGREIMFQDFNKFWGALYRAKMASRLKELGYSLTYLKNGEWRMNAVSQDLEFKLSTRRQQILAEKARGTLDMAAWRKTRKEKDPGVLKEKVQATWNAFKEQSAHLTSDDNTRRALDERERWFNEAAFSLEAQQERNGERGPEGLKRWLNAARRASDHSGCPTKEAIFTEYLTEHARGEEWKRISIKDVESEFNEAVKKGVFIKAGDGHYTTWELVRVEREWWETLQKKSSLRLDDKSVKALLQSKEDAQPHRQRLSVLQRAGVVNVFEQENSIVPVQGDAGSGKTTMLRYLKDVADEKDISILGLAMQGVAAKNLENESGIKSKTLVSFLAEKREGPLAHAIVVVDEASMLDSRNFTKLLENVDIATSKVVLVGDVNQLESIGAGRPFGRIVDDMDPKRVVHLSENFRQKDERLREAVSLARKGMVRESLDILEAEGKIREVAQKMTRLKEVAKLYHEKTLIIVGTTADRQTTNELIRAQVINASSNGSGKEETFTFGIPRSDGTIEKRKMAVRVGETLVFLKNEYKEYDVRNGQRGNVVLVGKNKLTIVLEDERRLHIDLGRYNNFDYGYALTTYKSQGLTFDKVVIESDTSHVAVNDMRHHYVNITRARQDVLIFTDDKEAMRDYAGIMQYKRDTLEDKSIDLEQARGMENRIRLLAGQSVQSTIEMAKASAKDTVGHMKESTDFKIDFSETKWVSLTNEKMLEKIRAIPDLSKTVYRRLNDAETLLNNTKTFSPTEKQKIAEFLSTPKAEKIFYADSLTTLGRLYVAADMVRLRDKEFLKELPTKEQVFGDAIKRTLAGEMGPSREIP